MNEVMDFEKYYIKKDGSYVVHFPNHKGFSKTTVTEMFSAYGKVVAVDNRGQQQGLCFVKYENVEDVKHCISGFKDHQCIKILAHKNKAKMANTRTKSQVYRQNESESNLRNQYKNNQRNCQFDNNMLKSLSINTSNASIKGNADFSDASGTGSAKTTGSDMYSINKTSSLKHLNLKHLRSSVLNQPLLSSVSQRDHSEKSKQLSNMDEIPALISVEQNPGFVHKRFSTTSPMVIMAQEVIVANIHHSLSVHYMLHLFEKYNPIAVSLMMTIPKSGIRYCHVYYKTSEDASAAVEEFDKCLLRGKNLIVLTLQKLMQEAPLL